MANVIRPVSETTNTSRRYGATAENGERFNASGPLNRTSYQCIICPMTDAF